MKKFIFSIFLFLSIVSSTFAGSDTDAICSDTNQLGLINKNIKVEYPTNEILIESVRKAYTAK
jgi:YbbR domain-containing protein